MKLPADSHYCHPAGSLGRHIYVFVFFFQLRRASETSVSPPGSSIGSPNRVICVSSMGTSLLVGCRTCGWHSLYAPLCHKGRILLCVLSHPHLLPMAPLSGDTSPAREFGMPTITAFLQKCSNAAQSPPGRPPSATHHMECHTLVCVEWEFNSVPCCCCVRPLLAKCV